MYNPTTLAYSGSSQRVIDCIHSYMRNIQQSTVSHVCISTSAQYIHMRKVFMQKYLVVMHARMYAPPPPRIGIQYKSRPDSKNSCRINHAASPDLGAPAESIMLRHAVSRSPNHSYTDLQWAARTRRCVRFEGAWLAEVVEIVVYRLSPCRQQRPGV